jgi:PAS domain-containing protein
MTLSPTEIDWESQFIPFVYSGGQFAEHITTVTVGRVVTRAGRQTFEQNLVSKGGMYKNFTISVKNAAGVMLPAPQSQQYITITMLAPTENYTNSLGFDYLSEYNRGVSCIKANQTRKISITPKLKLNRDSKIGNALIAPLFNRTTGEFFGVIGGAVATSDLINSALKNVTQDLLVSVYDISPDVVNNTEQSFMWTSYKLNDPTKEATSKDVDALIADSWFTSSMDFDYIDRKYKVIFIPTDDFIYMYISPEKWIAVASGLVLSLLLIVMMIIWFFIGRIIRHRKVRIAFMEQLRRMDAEKVTLLETNKVKLQKLLNRIGDQERKTRLIINTIPDFIIVLDQNGRILHSNTSFEKTFGVTQDDFSKGMDVCRVFPQLDKSFYLNDCTRLETTMMSKLRLEMTVMLTVRSLRTDLTSDEDGSYVIIGHSTTTSSIVRNSSSAKPSQEGFMKRWKDPEFRKRIRDFARKEHNDENIVFLERVMVYKKKPLEVRVEMQDELYHLFVADDAEMKLNINANQRLEMKNLLERTVGDIDVFDTLEEFVRGMIVLDIYPRFLASENVE